MFVGFSIGYSWPLQYPEGSRIHHIGWMGHQQTRMLFGLAFAMTGAVAASLINHLWMPLGSGTPQDNGKDELANDK